MKKFNSNFLSLSDVLKKELEKMAGGRIKATVTLDKHWKTVVGEAVAQNARVLFLKNKILHVAVKNSTWLYELGFMREAILKQVQEKIPDVEVADIRFRMEK
jgi:predicted nucleic acid-binding Zn ribbon protein